MRKTTEGAIFYDTEADVTMHRWLGAGLVAMVLPLLAQAGFITGTNGLEGLGTFQGSLTYLPQSATTGELQVTLMNTSPSGNGGYITAFAFNNPGGAIDSVSFSSTSSAFHLLGGPNFSNEVDAQPFGHFDIGAAIGKSFNGGGSPSPGIGVSSIENFTFAFTGLGLDQLDLNDFFDELSVPPGAGQGTKSFVVRFRGFCDGGSDKVPLDPPSVVESPEPQSLAIAGSGLALAAGVVLRRRRSLVRSSTSF